MIGFARDPLTPGSRASKPALRFRALRKRAQMLREQSFPEAKLRKKR